ncbi:hypothetical protein [Acinetobacter modestus]|uniref:Roadblock/LC7 domain-containing protein n=1 Tax=Acinetobacter modestus TaxID=1776740 RepID=A0ABN0JN27_9GAMM|nr:hypothetical protein [Acinetobacter modestus]ENU26730.1 hypothetical protein F992_02279 [Acinetobacter modestus]GGA10970.1 hypothetical protein GCM10017554_03550 [Acinetobacter modestus]
MDDNFLLNQFSHIDGLIVLALIDIDDGAILESIGDHYFNIDIAALEMANIFNIQRELAQQLDEMDYLEGILISLQNQYHIIMPLESNQNLFLYSVLDRDSSNLAYARHEIQRIERNLIFYAY